MHQYYRKSDHKVDKTDKYEDGTRQKRVIKIEEIKEMMRKRYRGKMIKKKGKDERMINEIKLKKMIKK